MGLRQEWGDMFYCDAKKRKNSVWRVVRQPELRWQREGNKLDGWRERKKSGGRENEGINPYYIMIRAHKPFL